MLHMNAGRNSRFDFGISRLRFELVAVDSVVMPRDNKGNVLRGAFGTIFKDLCCGAVCRSCHESPLRNACAYAAMFEPSPPPGSERLSANQDIPRPFIFRPPLEPKTRYAPGDAFTFELLLFGRAVQYLAYFVVAFRELAERGFGVGRGRCRLHSIAAQQDSETWTLVYTDSDQCVRPAAVSYTANNLMSAEKSPVREVVIDFLTPTELKHDGQQVRIPEFHHLLKRLRDRINAIGCFYNDVTLDIDFAEVGRRAECVQRIDAEITWLDRDRFSTRTHQRHSIGGFVGRARFAGELSEFMPFLRVGEGTHVGQHAVWGNGQYGIVSAT